MRMGHRTKPATCLLMERASMRRHGISVLPMIYYLIFLFLFSFLPINLYNCLLCCYTHTHTHTLTLSFSFSLFSTYLHTLLLPWHGGRVCSRGEKKSSNCMFSMGVRFSVYRNETFGFIIS